jgi:hypothetical protein
LDVFYTIDKSPGDFESEDKPGQWVCWDFGDLRLSLTFYTMRTCFLRQWVVEGSVDGTTWMELSRVLEGDCALDTWMVTFAAYDQTPYRYIRLTQTGKNSLRTDVLNLGFCEFFGTLSE